MERKKEYRKTEEPKNDVIHIRVTSEEKEMLKKICSVKEVTASEEISGYIRREVERVICQVEGDDNGQERYD